MAEEVTPQATETATPGSTASTERAAVERAPERIYLVSYPKIVFLYPTFLAALIAGIYMTIAGNEPGTERHDTEILSLVFLMIAGVNLVVLSFDFPRTTSLTLFFFVAAAVMGLVLTFRVNEDILPFLTNLLDSVGPWANAQFYFIFAGILALIYVAVAISVQFDYWEVRPNELLHHHGVLSDLKRFSAPNLRIDKEISDVFEYALLRSGRLILHPSNERRAIVLENIFFINRKEEELTRMLGALQVQVRSDNH